jgi:pyridoxamine 5'-phosphate oxidase
MEHTDMITISDLRKEFTGAGLSQAQMADDPMAQFAIWFDEARRAELPELNAMSLATAGIDGRPASRIVLLKDFGPEGLTWFTQYDSRKGRQLRANPYGALLFHWLGLERQVSIEGRVERVPEAESDAYFAIRPLASRLGAVASSQSQPIGARALLDAKFAEAETRYGEHPPRPPQWGGYRLRPERMEFWQGGRARLHDRILYTVGGDGSWQRLRLQP